MKTWSTAPKMDYDAANPGTCVVGLEMKIPAHTKGFINVALIPQGNISNQQTKTLAQWPKN